MALYKSYDVRLENMYWRVDVQIIPKMWALVEKGKLFDYSHVTDFVVKNDGWPFFFAYVNKAKYFARSPDQIIRMITNDDPDAQFSVVKTYSEYTGYSD